MARSLAANSTAVSHSRVHFYMYTDRSLDFSWLRTCPSFRELRLGVKGQNMAEVGLHKVLRRHALRVELAGGGAALLRQRVGVHLARRRRHLR